MTRTRRDLRKRRLRILAVLCLAACLLVFFWSRHGTGNPALPRPDRQLEKAQGPHSTAEAPSSGTNISQSPPPARGIRPVPVDGPSAAALAADYESEEFTHVPDWMPRPADAVSARADDASLRSDGFVEGRLRYLFRADHASALEEITSQLQSAGMGVDATGKVFSSEEPPRRCEVMVENTPDGGMMVSLHYQGTDHEKGCRCPTCGKAPESSNP
jgi:hypothetical protein